jgi:redox-regulated HSP33 family molecular chaperone
MHAQVKRLLGRQHLSYQAANYTHECSCSRGLLIGSIVSLVTDELEALDNEDFT